MRVISGPVRVGLLLAAVVAALTGLLVVTPALMLMSTAGISEPTPGAAASSAPRTCGPSSTVGGRQVQLTDTQLANARQIIRVGRELHVPERGLVVALATALQESTLRNLSWGDRDSVGLFQQRNAWGAAELRMDVAASARMFYTGGRAGQPGLLDIDGWWKLSITRAAQAVQRSAFPLAYAQWEPMARELVAAELGRRELGCDDTLQPAVPAGTVGTMLQAALQQQGDPYVWGAVGPDAFDCSGLVVFAWRQAGYRLSVRTAAQMYAHSDPVPRDQAQPGDLLFGDFGARSAGPGHVMIVIGGGRAVQAPAAGRTVEITDYRGLGPSWTVGRLRSSVKVEV